MTISKRMTPQETEEYLSRPEIKKLTKEYNKIWREEQKRKPTQDLGEVTND